MEDREFLEEFLNLYKLYPCLWNSKCKEYSNRQLRESATTVLINKCKERYTNSDRSFVMKKIHSFRCAFRRELEKVVTSLKSGTSADEVYVPNLWYYDILSFIADSEMPREGRANLGGDYFQDGSEMEDFEGDSEQLGEQAIPNIHDEIMDSPMQSPEPESSRPGSSQSSSSAKRPRYTETPKYGRSKGKDVKKDELLVLASATMKKYCSAEASQTPQASLTSLSDVDIAGIKYARDLTSLNPVQRSFVEKLVADAIFYARLGKLTEHSTVQHSISSLEHPPSYNTNYPQQSVYNNGFTPSIHQHSVNTFPNIASNSNESVQIENVQSEANDLVTNMSQYLTFTTKP